MVILVAELRGDKGGRRQLRGRAAERNCGLAGSNWGDVRAVTTLSNHD